MAAGPAWQLKARPAGPAGPAADRFAGARDAVDYA